MFGCKKGKGIRGIEIVGESLLEGGIICIVFRCYKYLITKVSRKLLKAEFKQANKYSIKIETMQSIKYHVIY